MDLRRVLDPSVFWAMEDLSSALSKSLQQLVTLDGGWRTRPTFRRPAYDSSAMRKLRLRLAELHHLQKLTRLCSGAAAGCWPQALVVCCSKLRQKGVALPMGSIGTLRSAALSHLKLVKAEISQLGSEMRRARHHRWKENLPSL